MGISLKNQIIPGGQCPGVGCLWMWVFGRQSKEHLLQPRRFKISLAIVQKGRPFPAVQPGLLLTVVVCHKVPSETSSSVGEESPPFGLASEDFTQRI